MLPEDEGVLERAEGTKIEWNPGALSVVCCCVRAQGQVPSLRLLAALSWPCMVHAGKDVTIKIMKKKPKKGKASGPPQVGVPSRPWALQ